MGLEFSTATYESPREKAAREELISTLKSGDSSKSLEELKKKMPPIPKDMSNDSEWKEVFNHESESIGKVADELKDLGSVFKEIEAHQHELDETAQSDNDPGAIHMTIKYPGT
eukprot:GHVO01009415.1.p1 GENE.GHVO01009415.1~~GHVO01009415.1.p1  ORF type:complete len:113 (+),score=18.75 GHVO01009415.1:260-598(+)